MSKADLRFEREGRTLGEWLLDLVSPELEVRRRAGEAVVATMFAIPSVHTDMAEKELGSIGGEVRREEFGRAVRNAVAQMSAAQRGAFVRELVNRKIVAFERRMAEHAAQDARFNRFADRLQSRIDAAQSEAERARYRRRLTRSICADQRPRDAGAGEELATHHMAVGWVFEKLDMVLLETPDAIIRLLDHPHFNGEGVQALCRIGPPAAPIFYERILQECEEPRPHGLAALASIGRGRSGLLLRLIEWIEQSLGVESAVDAADSTGDFHHSFYDADRAWPAAQVLAALGPAVIDDPAHGFRVVPMLLQMTRSPRPGHRAAAAHALGGVAGKLNQPEMSHVVERLLELTQDHSWVAGRAIDALATLRSDAARIVPRLVELFDAFEEFDPDQAYAGEHARVCDALELFGSDAGVAVPRLLRYMNEWLESDLEDRSNCRAVVRALETIGAETPEVKGVLTQVRELEELAGN